MPDGASDIADISGLQFKRNYYAETGSDSYTIVANPGPRVSDFHQWYKNEYEAFVAHIAQIDRFTFFGPPEQQIDAEFVDCRAGSKSFLGHAAISLTPDARRCLEIPAGVAVHFKGLQNLAIRSEPILLAPPLGGEYFPGNDQVRIATSTALEDFPVLEVGGTPIPGEALRILLAHEQRVISEGFPYKTSFLVPTGTGLSRMESSAGPAEL